VRLKITDLHIYGYGKLSDFKISALSDLHVIYGENEAGKSTIMSFIHSILFGFPTKQQSELRYEPKAGAKYGGQLTVTFPEAGKVMIERVKGKASGDVSVLFEDGTSGGEEGLKKLLSHVDKSLFQSIFSFNLHGLQNIHQMKNEDLGRFLFSAGALGTDKLMFAENTLQKEIDARFKPNGKKPSLNIKLKEVKELHRELRKAEQQNEKYRSLLQEKENAEKEIAKAQSEESDAREKVKVLHTWKQLLPLMTEERALKEEISELVHLEFPIDGVERLNRLEDLIKPLEGQILNLKNKIKDLEIELYKGKPDDLLLSKEQEIDSAIEGLSVYEKLMEEERELQNRLAQLKQEEDAIAGQLHITLPEEELFSINTSIFKKEKIAAAQEKYRRLKVRRLELDERFNEEKNMLEKIEDKINELKSQVLPETKRKSLEDQLQLKRNKQALDEELKQMEERILACRKAKKKREDKVKKKIKQDMYQRVFFLLIFIGLLSAGFMLREMLIVVIGLIGLLFSAYLFFGKTREYQDDFINEELSSLIGRKAEIERKINESSAQDFTSTEHLLKLDQEASDKLRHYQIQLEHRNEQFEHAVKSFETWEKDKDELEEEMMYLGKDLCLSRDISISFLSEAFGLIEKLKELAKEKKGIIQKLVAISARIKEFSSAVKDLRETFIKQETKNVQEACYLLRKCLKEELEKQIKYTEKQNKLTELKKELSHFMKEAEHYNEERKNLFVHADAENEEEFREKGLLASKKIVINERILELQRQIKLFPLNEKDRKEYGEIKDAEPLIQFYEGKLAEVKDALPIWQSKLAQLKYEIQQLEEGGTYTELLHEYKLKKSELELEAKQWAKYAMAKNILDRTIESFKNERLPRMLEKAEEFLSTLTEGNYVRIYPKQEGSGFFIENKEQIRFEANELSQATAEQVYASLRLALALTIYEKYPFPIIIDDSFVNFDHKRTKRMIELLKTISQRQILFFTCHKHLLSYFSEEQIVLLDRKTSLSH